MTPGPTNVSTEVMQAMLHPIINHRSPAFAAAMDSLLIKAKNTFQTKGDVVVLTSSGTGAVEASITNLLRDGDSVLVTAFGEFGERLADQIQDVGATAIRVESEYGNTPTLDNVREAFEQNEELKALYVVSNETSTGASIKWLKEAGDLASKAGAFFVVDAISNFGGDWMPVDEYKIDICCAGSQKCLASPPGVSMLSISEKAKQFIVNNPPKRHYLNLPRYFKYAEKNETPFTPALPLYFALDRSLEIILDEGLDRVIERHAICANAFYSGLSEMGLKMFAKTEVRSNTVIAINYPEGVNDKEFRAKLDADYGVILAGGFGRYLGKVFRIGSMGVVGRYHVIATLTAIGMTLKKMGFEANVDGALSLSSSILSKLSRSA